MTTYDRRTFPMDLTLEVFRRIRDEAGLRSSRALGDRTHSRAPRPTGQAKALIDSIEMGCRSTRARAWSGFALLCFAIVSPRFSWGGVISGLAVTAVPVANERWKVGGEAVLAGGALPRFERLWRREGLGHFEGATNGNTYYAVANDGRSLHALDVTTGRTLWQRPLVEPATDSLQVRFVNGQILLAYERSQSPDTLVLAAVSAREGKTTWSKAVRCPEMPLRTRETRVAGSHFFLVCGAKAAEELRELDPASGEQLTSIFIGDRCEVTPSGDVCGMSKTETWCGRIAHDRVEVLWRQADAGGSDLDSFEVTSESVTRIVGRRIVVRRERDGRLVWKRSMRGPLSAFVRTDRVFVIAEDSVEVLRLSDGVSLAKRAHVYSGDGVVLTDGDLVMLVPLNRADDPVYLVDAQSHIRPIARNVTFFNAIAGGVLLSQNVGIAPLAESDAFLEAFSLARLAPPLDALDPYHRTLALLEWYPDRYQAMDILATLRAVPEVRPFSPRRSLRSRRRSGVRRSRRPGCWVMRSSWLLCGTCSMGSRRRRTHRATGFW